MNDEPKSGVKQTSLAEERERERERRADHETLITCRACLGVGLLPAEEMSRWRRGP